MSVVLVLSADTMLARIICKNLYKYHYQIIAAGSSKGQICSFSRYVQKCFIYSDPKQDERKFIDDIIGICLSNGVEVLIPVLGETVVIAKYRVELARYVKLLVPSCDVLSDFVSKCTYYKIASSAGLNVPLYWPAQVLSPDHPLPKELTYPCLAKLNRSWGGYGMYEFSNATQLIRFLSIEQDRDKYFIQRRVSGKVLCVAMICANGKVYAWDTFRILASYPSENGQSTVRETVKNDTVVEALKTLLESVRWTGVCQADFIVDSDSGEPYLIDINARFWNSLVQSTARQIDFPYYYCKLACGDADFDVQPSRDEVTTAWFSRALRGHFGLLLRITLVPFFKGDLRRFVAEFDDWDMHDPLPFFVWLIRGIVKSVKERLANLVGRM